VRSIVPGAPRYDNYPPPSKTFSALAYGVLNLCFTGAELHLAGKHAFQPLTHILPVDDVPESTEVVAASVLVFRD